MRNEHAGIEILHGGKLLSLFRPRIWAAFCHNADLRQQESSSCFLGSSSYLFLRRRDSFTGILPNYAGTKKFSRYFRLLNNFEEHHDRNRWIFHIFFCSIMRFRNDASLENATIVSLILDHCVCPIARITFKWHAGKNHFWASEMKRDWKERRSWLRVVFGAWQKSDRQFVAILKERTRLR